LALGLAWWVALLIPEDSRRFLVQGTWLTRGWAFARVVGIVTVACMFFRYCFRRYWPGLSPLAAIACWFGGSAAFLATDPEWNCSIENAAAAVVVGPALFLLFAWFVVVPMTALTALVLAGLERRKAAVWFQE
jgi:hypothetical protein